MFNKILIAHDGSPGSERVVPLAVEMAKSSGAELVIAHIDEQTIGKGGGSINAADDDVRASLRKRAEQLSDAGVKTEFETRAVMIGGPAQVLARIADDLGADLIVAGSRGQSPLGGLLLGSVAHRLLQVSHQPVMIVPESVRTEELAETTRLAAASV
jgi:nucleotide-binding universal stress UspA family protein